MHDQPSFNIVLVDNYTSAELFYSQITLLCNLINYTSIITDPIFFHTIQIKQLEGLVFCKQKTGEIPPPAA